MADLVEEGLLNLEDSKSDGKEGGDDENAWNDSLEESGHSFGGNNSLRRIDHANVGFDSRRRLRLQTRLNNVSRRYRTRSNASCAQTSRKRVWHRKIAVLVL